MLAMQSFPISVAEKTKVDIEAIKVPETWELKSALHQRSYLVNGEIRNWFGEQENVFSPLTNNVKQSLIGSYPLLGSKESLEILDSAKSAYGKGLGEWPSATLEKRIEATEVFLKALEKSKAEIVKLIVWEIGKSVPDATKEFDRTVQYVEETITYLRATANKVEQVGGMEVKYSREAIGTVLCMGPFNYPLNETLTTVLPALLMGNTVILKPAKQGVLLYGPIAKAFQEAFPAGAINLVYGDGREVVTPLMQSGDIDALVFIGSTKVADILSKQHPAPHRLKMVLGLGAKNPAIITANADLLESVDAVIKGALSFNGQRCTALKNIFVHKSVYQDFAKLLAYKVDQLTVGQPWEEGVFITPVAEPNKADALDAFISDAVAQGAKVLNQNGGAKESNLYHPVVLGDVNSKMKIFHEEQFGPVVPLIPYDDSSEILEALANSPFGQQASIFSKDEAEINALAGPLQRLTARVNINQVCERGPDYLPFSGRKSSAMGTISIPDAVKEFSLETLLVRKAI